MHSLFDIKAAVASNITRPMYYALQVVTGDSLICTAGDILWDDVVQTCIWIKQTFSTFPILPPKPISPIEVPNVFKSKRFRMPQMKSRNNDIYNCFSCFAHNKFCLLYFVSNKFIPSYSADMVSTLSYHDKNIEKPTRITCYSIQIDPSHKSHNSQFV